MRLTPVTYAPWYNEAISFVGTTEEPGLANDNPDIIRFAKLARLGWDYTSDEIPWCAVFVNAMLELAGYRGTGSAMAKSFLNYGETVHPYKAVIGDLVIFDRPSAGPEAGHVGFFVGWGRNHETMYILGGNQSNSVRVSQYRVKDRLRAVKRPTERQLRQPVALAGVSTSRMDRVEELLAEDGSRIVHASRKQRKIISYGSVGLLVLNALDQAKGYIDQAMPAFKSLTSALSFAADHWFLVVSLLGAGLIYYAWIIRDARVEDEITGKTRRLDEVPD